MSSDASVMLLTTSGDGSSVFKALGSSRSRDLPSTYMYHGVLDQSAMAADADDSVFRSKLTAMILDVPLASAKSRTSGRMFSGLLSAPGVPRRTSVLQSLIFW